jgi:hypothetical protein
MGTALNLELVYERVAAEAARVAALGEWPDYIAPESLLERLPLAGDTASGFDAGIACALDLIPRPRQSLAARLHAAYTPQAIAQVQAEMEALVPDSETVWWLAGCAVCEESGVDQARFQRQLEEFGYLVKDSAARQLAARRCLEGMLSTYQLRDGIPYGDVDGCMHGAYLAGHPLATMYDRAEDLYYVGTYLNTLGLEDFSWSQATDAKGRPRSGPVHGSRQYVKCADAAELEQALQVARTRLGV